jgi:hypothetical protein
MVLRGQSRLPALSLPPYVFIDPNQPKLPVRRNPLPRVKSEPDRCLVELFCACSSRACKRQPTPSAAPSLSRHLSTSCPPLPPSHRLIPLIASYTDNTAQMNIFVQDVPKFITDRKLRASFVTPLRECGAIDFHCHHPKDKAFAFLTILNTSAGEFFLSRYGVRENAPRNFRLNKGPLCGNQLLRCQRSHNAPSDRDIAALEYEGSRRVAEEVLTVPRDNKHTRKFDVSRVHCGMWDYDMSSQLTFHAHYSLFKPGKVIFGKRQLVLLLGDIGADQIRMDVFYHSCDNIAISEDWYEPTVTLTLHHSPIFYKVKGDDVLEAALLALSLGPEAGRKRSIGKERILGFDDAHLKIAGACKVYQVRLSASNMIPRVRSLLHSSAKMPTHMSLTKSLQYPSTPWDRAYRRLNTQLTDTALFGKLPHSVRFQVDRIARNGYLSPLKTLELLPTVRSFLETLGQEEGPQIVAFVLRRLTRSLPVPGPDTYEQYTVDYLATQIFELADSYDSDAPNNPYELVKKHQHINLVHRIVITPTGLTLEGPDPEPTNRILRYWHQNIDHFTRVVFCDEDGGPVRHDPKASQRIVYDDRFRAMLAKPIIIVGMAYDFLGFSHSALRSHSCWSMAPIFAHGTLFFASLVLKALGNFDLICTPAKCAARIGQNFTVSTLTVYELSKRTDKCSGHQRDNRSCASKRWRTPNGHARQL